MAVAVSRHEVQSVPEGGLEAARERHGVRGENRPEFAAAPALFRIGESATPAQQISLRLEVRERTIKDGVGDRQLVHEWKLLGGAGWVDDSDSIRVGAEA